MAQSGYTPISLYYSSTSGVAPTSGNLVNGELAINITDGKLYFKNTSGAVTLLASAAGAVAATNLSGGTSGQIPYQNGASSTTFMVAPTTASTYLGWNGSGFYWSSTTGVSGYSGFSGYSGGTGTNGVSGYSGYSGYSGSGISGYSGYSGATGTGTSGYSGVSGYSGYSSFSGFSGFSGYSGVSGYSGLGLSGYSGISGYSGATSSSTANSVTFNSSGSGASSPTSFNGSVAQTISYNTIGAPGISGTNATGTWPISISGTAATATNQSGGTVSATSIAYSTTLTGGTGIVNLGSGQFYKDASGNVSIGSTSTPATLYVRGGNSNNLSIDNGGQQFTTVSLYNNGTEKAQMYWDQTNTLFVFGTDVSAPVVFKAATVERMRISSAGGVSIGTTTDAGVGNLLVNGTVTASNHIGPGTGLTGTASALSIGGNAATATTAANGGVTSVNGLTGAVTVSNLPGIFAQKFTSSGTFTIPAGVTAIKVTLIGGGGGGTSNNQNNGGSGGTSSVGSINAYGGGGGPRGDIGFGTGSTGTLSGAYFAMSKFLDQNGSDVYGTGGVSDGTGGSGLQGFGYITGLTPGGSISVAVGGGGGGYAAPSGTAGFVLIEW